MALKPNLLPKPQSMLCMCTCDHKGAKYAVLQCASLCLIHYVLSRLCVSLTRSLTHSLAPFAPPSHTLTRPFRPSLPLAIISMQAP